MQTTKHLLAHVVLLLLLSMLMLSPRFSTLLRRKIGVVLSPPIEYMN
jgi:hypothetical protein